VEQEEFAVHCLHSDDRGDRGPCGQGIEDGCNGHALHGADRTEATANKSAPGFNESWSANLNVLDFVVGHLGQRLPVKAGEDAKPVFQEPSVVAFTNRNGCLWGVAT
jgi:hypothetical protein